MDSRRKLGLESLSSSPVQYSGYMEEHQHVPFILVNSLRLPVHFLHN